MIYLLIILSIIAVDRFSKLYVEKNFKISDKKEIIKNKLYINHMKNKGAAYGILKSRAKELLIFNCLSVSVISLVLLYLIKKIKGEFLLKTIFSFIIGGALGNIIDRIKNGCVTDFIYFKFKKAPVFNIADLFLISALFLSVIRFFKDK